MYVLPANIAVSCWLPRICHRRERSEVGIFQVQPIFPGRWRCATTGLLNRLTSCDLSMKARELPLIEKSSPITVLESVAAIHGTYYTTCLATHTCAITTAPGQSGAV